MAAAAESLSFTPSAVSQQIATLERETGATLVEKFGRGVRLTDAALLLVRRTETILAELARAEADLAAVKEARAGSLTVGAFPTSGTRLVPTALRLFIRKHPDVDVQLAELEPEESLPMLQTGALDIALAFECDLVPLGRGEFEAETLFSEPMLVVHSRDVSTKGTTIDLADLNEERWIAPATGTSIHSFTRRACQGAGFEPRITSIWTDFQVVQSLAAHNFGVAFVPRLALSPARNDVVVRRTSSPLERRVFVAWRRGTAKSPLVDAIVDVFREAVDESTGTFGGRA